MRKILIFGNSGSGKSTLAKKLCESNRMPHLDLDNLAWQPTLPPQRKPLDQSGAEISRFISANSSWVIEGCYTDLLEFALEAANEVIYMNLSIELCIENAKSRPWEPHKYESKEAQDKNFDMLISWISGYSTRKDTFSEAEHLRLFDGFDGIKTTITNNESTHAFI